mmetsp:Transcript_1504/g.2155  ORF Transcript_1504/g.2155 Transcript_1504/m.2155 type:complete len:214 (-) Transcript_1504:67-708(-)
MHSSQWTELQSIEETIPESNHPEDNLSFYSSHTDDCTTTTVHGTTIQKEESRTNTNCIDRSTKNIRNKNIHTAVSSTINTSPITNSNTRKKKNCKKMSEMRAEEKRVQIVSKVPTKKTAICREGIESQMKHTRTDATDGNILSWFLNLESGIDRAAAISITDPVFISMIIATSFAKHLAFNSQHVGGSSPVTRTENSVALLGKFLHMFVTCPV